ncbi:trigger factor [Candidatus Walczuchella monophlebidarum]|uniref:Putative cell division trigger factor n=1 Tax=Candidatus Walczuchella monophlebidarum TaxID=1415657 RepID=A0A068DQI9_9FLAO|nr:trigger factor [Candidatus Walczuchella monophlebidarum]AID37517.1 putative cell division trigger factor [Candidatus Walczuchella monophlebidarum]
MNITRKQLDELNIILTVSFNKSAFKDKIENRLKGYHKKAQFPGFRKGKVPIEIIKTHFYKKLVHEEIQFLLQKNISDYISREGLHILGNIFPKKENILDVNAEEFVLEFELGLVPQFDIPPLNNLSIPYYNIELKEEDIHHNLEKFQQRCGFFFPKKIIDESDYIQGKITAIHSNNRENLPREYAFSLKNLPKKTGSKFLKKERGNIIDINTSELFLDENSWSNFIGKFGVSHFPIRFSIENIFKVHPAPLNKDFFYKVFGENKVTSLEDFNRKFKKHILKNYTEVVDKFSFYFIFYRLFELVRFDLPSKFLTRYLKYTKSKKGAEDNFFTEYDQFEKYLRYRFFEKKLSQKLKINIRYEDIEASVFSLAYTKRYNPINAEKMQIRKIYNFLFRNSLIQVFRERSKNKTISWSDFLNLLKDYNKKDV